MLLSLVYNYKLDYVIGSSAACAQFYDRRVSGFHTPIYTVISIIVSTPYRLDAMFLAG